MPWSRNQDLPAQVRSALPAEAQTVFRRVGNDRMDAGDSEQSAIRQAWAAVRQGWKKPDGDGKWVRKAGMTTFQTDAQVLKVDDSLGLVFGWAIISKQDGEDYFDSQGDHIPEDAMLKAAAEFSQGARLAKEMHVGDGKGSVAFLFPLTSEIAKAHGIQTSTTGLLIAIKPDSDEMLAKFRDGTFTGFSIGGKRITDEEVTS